MAVANAPKKPAPAGKPPVGAKPGKPKKEKVAKIDYPLPDVVDDEGNPIEGAPDYVNADGLLLAMPPDFDPRKHNKFKKTAFASEATFLLIRADQLEKQAAKLRQMAEDASRLGNVADKPKAKKLLSLANKYKAMLAELSATMTPEEIAALTGGLQLQVDGALSETEGDETDADAEQV